MARKRTEKEKKEISKKTNDKDPQPSKYLRKGLIGQTMSADMDELDLPTLRKHGAIWAPGIADYMGRYIRHLSVKKAADLGLAVATGSDLEILSAAESVAKSTQVRKGLMYQYLVSDCIERAIGRKIKHLNFIPEAPVGKRYYDLCILPTLVGEEWRIDVEASMSVRTPKYESELWRHGGKPFYLVTNGYDLRPRIVDELLENDCQPVVTVGANHKGVITYDQMIEEIIEAIIELRGGTPSPPLAAVA